MNINAELAAAKQRQTTKQQFLDYLEKIEGLQGAKRWRAVKDFLLKINPKIKPIDDQFCAEVRKTRDNLMYSHGGSKSGDTRNLLDMPTYMYEALILCDPEFNYNVNISHDKEVQKRAWRAVAKAFPEYALGGAVA